jgi:lipoprotein NlpI
MIPGSQDRRIAGSQDRQAVGSPPAADTMARSILKIPRRLSWLTFFLTFLSGAPVSAQVPVPPDSGASQSTKAAEDEVLINASKTPLPKLPPDEFSNCLRRSPSGEAVGKGSFDPVQGGICQAQIEREKHIVMEACVNSTGNTAPPRVIQACTELLDRQIYEGRDRFPLFANRARAYFAQGDKTEALGDYNEAVKLASGKAKADLYYARGLVYAAESNDDAALQDFDTTIDANSKSVPALRQRAKIYQHRDNFSSSLQDYTEAIRLEPKNAVLWSERGYVSLRSHDYQGAVNDETQAVSLDPKLAWAYFLRGTAFGNSGDSGNASSDIKTAVGLDPSLAKYVVIKGKTVSLLLPPPPSSP